MNGIKIACTVFALMFLVSLVGFFAGTETAYISMTDIRLRKMLRERVPGAKKVAALCKDMDGLLTVILVGINFINTLASSIATALAIELVGSGGVGIASLSLTFFVTVFGQIVPKTVAGIAGRTEKIAARNATAIIILKKILFPVVWTLSKVSRGVARLLATLWRADDAIINEDELKSLIEAGEADGSLEKNERAMLDKILEITDLTVHSIMKHRSLVTYIEASASLGEVIEAFKKSGFSHLPVYKESTENIIGVLYYKDILFKKPSPAASPTASAQAPAARSENAAAPAAFSVEKYATPPLFIPETFSVIELVQAFKKESRSFAVALDEHGSTAGIVTLDDVLRGLFGRMSDTLSQSGGREVAAEERVTIISPKEFLLPGDMRLGDVNSILNLSLHSDEYDTLAGWLLEQFDALPVSGAVLWYGDDFFVVEEQSDRRIKRVRIKVS